MSDSLPENELSGVLRVIKLVSGEEIVSLVNEPSEDKITIKLPAKMENYYGKENGSVVEYIKLTNYLSSIKGNEVTIQKSLVLYMGQPTLELQKMYEVFFMTMQTDPKSVAHSENSNSVEPGLQLLNDLFNNEEFVNFVNDMIESFEGSGILIDSDDEEEYGVESVIEDFSEEEEEPKAKPKKRRKTKPEASKMPYDPELPPENPESWSDNPSDYT